jgi:DNA-binding transcriptional regulator YiaG
MKKLSREITRIRRSLGLSMAAYAEQLDTYHYCISRYEQGVATPSLRTLSKIIKHARANNIDVGLDDFIL